MALKLEKIRKRMPGFTLEADFEVASGQRAALVGRSGSGKTSLLRIIAGLEAPDSGTIRIGETEITRIPARDRQIGFVFQDSALFPSLSVLENVVFGLRLRGVAAEEMRTQGIEWLKRVGLQGLADEPVDRLSGGERQRVAFLRAVIWKPAVLLLDEPFSALDPGLRGVLRSELIELHRLCPVPMLLVSHDEADLEAVATARLTLRENSDHSVRSVSFD